MSNSAFAPVLYPQLEPETQAGASSAHARGYAAGFAEGLRRASEEQARAEQVRQAEVSGFLASGQAQLAGALAAMNRAVSELNARLAPVIEDADAVLIETSLELAEAVLRREVSEGHVTAADTLRRALELVPDDQTVTVRMNPADVATLGEQDGAAFVLVADASVAPGDAMTSMADGWLDVRVFVALERAKSVLLGERT